MTVPSVLLNDGKSIPQLGFGVWQVPDGIAEPAVAKALEVGYRHIDTAAVYLNERGVGKAIAKSGVPREELYITTKLWNADQGYESTLTALDASLERLGLDYVDLYLIHWPLAKNGLFVETFKAFQKAKEAGKVRSIGVSNFHEPQLRQVIEETGETPVLNQVELHPHYIQAALREAHEKLGVATQAWSPLGKIRVGEELDPAITQIAESAGKSPVQVVLRWHLQLGNIVIPKSQTPERIAANFEVFDFELAPEQVAQISALAEEPKLGPEPDDFYYAKWPGSQPE